MADPFPLYVPPESPRLFQSEALLRRFAQLAHWNEEANLLELHGSIGALAIARALFCRLTVVEPHPRLAEALKERAGSLGVEARVTIRSEPWSGIQFAEQAFDGIFSFGRIIGLVDQVCKRWRPFLADDGRLGISAMVRVGRSVNEPVLALWQQRLGTSLLSPHELMMSIEAQGFEPELIEVLNEDELTRYYQELETALATTVDTDSTGAQALRDEIALHRKGQTGVTIAFIVARRKEPGEKPLPARDGG